MIGFLGVEQETVMNNEAKMIDLMAIIERKRPFVFLRNGIESFNKIQILLFHGLDFRIFWVFVNLTKISF